MPTPIPREGPGAKNPGWFAKTKKSPAPVDASEFCMNEHALSGTLNSAAIISTAQALGVPTKNRRLSTVLTEVINRKLAAEADTSLALQEQATKLKGTPIKRAEALIQEGVRPEQAILAAARTNLANSAT